MKVKEKRQLKVLLVPVCCVCLAAQSCLTLCTSRTVACQAPLSTEFSRWEYWSGRPFPSPGGLSDPGIEPGSPALQADSLLSEPPGKPLVVPTHIKLDEQTSQYSCFPPPQLSVPQSSLKKVYPQHHQVNRKQSVKVSLNNQYSFLNVTPFHLTLAFIRVLWDIRAQITYWI